MRRPDPCGCPTRLMSPAEAVMLLRTLYTAGMGYHLLAELTRLNLSHEQARQLVTIPDPGRQALYLEAVMQ